MQKMVLLYSIMMVPKVLIGGIKLLHSEEGKHAYILKWSLEHHANLFRKSEITGKSAFDHPT